jgi:alkaline ceramidase TOD1/glycosyltransferase MUCI70-like protein
MTVAIYTARFGRFDDGRPQTPQDIDVAWYAFTDGPSFPAPWQTIQVLQLDPCPRLAAKRYKALPALAESQSIWIDANTEIISPTFARETLAQLHDGIALFAHPQRNCIYQEAIASLRLAPRKYGHLPIQEQVDYYRAQGYPEHGGLFACGTIARDHSAPKLAELGRRWLHECVRWTYQDQLSFPVVCRELGIVPGIFNERQIGARDHAGNRWQKLHSHRSDR